MSVVFAMCLFSLSMSISPGPVNLITLSAGVNYGFRSAMPFVSGATMGFTLLLLMVGLGLGGMAVQSPDFLDWLGYGGAGFIIYMGYKTAVSSAQISINTAARPSFYQGVLLQWLNPKAWMACLAGVSMFDLAGDHTRLGIFVSLYFIICYVSVAIWALAGEKIGIFFQNSKNLQLFNRVTGGALVVVAIYLLFLQSADIRA